MGEVGIPMPMKVVSNQFTASLKKRIISLSSLGQTSTTHYIHSRWPKDCPSITTIQQIDDGKGWIQIPKTTTARIATIKLHWNKQVKGCLLLANYFTHQRLWFQLHKQILSGTHCVRHRQQLTDFPHIVHVMTHSVLLVSSVAKVRHMFMQWRLSTDEYTPFLQ